MKGYTQPQSNLEALEEICVSEIVASSRLHIIEKPKEKVDYRILVGDVAYLTL